MVTEDKSNIFYKIDCSNCGVVYFGEPKKSLRFVFKMSCGSKKTETVEYCWKEDHNLN